MILSHLPLIFILICLLSDILYILFREPAINRYNKIFISAACIFSVVNFITDQNISGLIRILSLLLLLSANVKLKNPEYEKPDYRYLIILLGVIALHLEI